MAEIYNEHRQKVAFFDFNFTDEKALLFVKKGENEWSIYTLDEKIFSHEFYYGVMTIHFGNSEDLKIHYGKMDQKLNYQTFSIVMKIYLEEIRTKHTNTARRKRQLEEEIAAQNKRDEEKRNNEYRLKWQLLVEKMNAYNNTNKATVSLTNEWLNDCLKYYLFVFKKSEHEYIIGVEMRTKTGQSDVVQVLKSVKSTEEVIKFLNDDINEVSVESKIIKITDVMKKAIIENPMLYLMTPQINESNLIKDFH